MTTFLKEVARKSTWMLALKLGCTNDGNKRIATSKGATTWGFKTRETKSQERPPCSNVVGNGNGEITSIITKGENVTFDNVGNHSPPNVNVKNLMNHCHQKASALITYQPEWFCISNISITCKIPQLMRSQVPS